MSFRNLFCLIVVLAVAGIVSATPYATEVISYTAGNNAVSGYTNPSTALGEPERQTGWGDVTMFNPPWLTDEIVSIGAGGSLVVKFDHQVLDNSETANWGIDFLVFGNAMFTNSGGTASGCFAEPANIAVSQYGTTWYDIDGIYADNLFPTQGFTDTSSIYGSDGSTPTDFTLPVDPGIAWNGKTYSELLTLYNGSGGGTGVDFSGTGLDWIQYAKVYQDSTDTWSAEIDAFADVVPEPATLALLGLGGLLSRRRR